MIDDGASPFLEQDCFVLHVSCPLFKHRSFVEPPKGTCWRMLPSLFVCSSPECIHIQKLSSLCFSLFPVSLISLQRRGGQAWLILLKLCRIICKRLSFDPNTEDNIMGLCVLQTGLLGRSHTFVKLTNNKHPHEYNQKLTPRTFGGVTSRRHTYKSHTYTYIHVYRTTQLWKLRNAPGRLKE